MMFHDLQIMDQVCNMPKTNDVYSMDLEPLPSDTRDSGFITIGRSVDLSQFCKSLWMR